jgi:hypothetical protein
VVKIIRAKPQSWTLSPGHWVATGTNRFRHIGKGQLFLLPFILSWITVLLLSEKVKIAALRLSILKGRRAVNSYLMNSLLIWR